MLRNTLTTLAAIATLTTLSPANAATIDALITVDNHFGLYVGDEDGTNLNYIGRNDTGWGTPESFTFGAANAQRIYVYAWDYGGPQSFLGQFEGWNGTLFTNLDDWEWTFMSNNQSNPGQFGDPLSAPDLEGLIAGSTDWHPIRSAYDNGFRWPTVPGFSSEARLIWGDSIEYGSAVLTFRSTQLIDQGGNPEPVPEPAPLALLGLGLIGFGLSRRNKK